MKALLFLLLFPFFVQAQTVHRKGKKILYEGEVALPGRSTQEVLAQLQAAAGSLVRKGKEPAGFQANGETIVALADMPLGSANNFNRLLHYTLQLTAKEGGYSYRIDSVYVLDKKRDGGEEKHTAKELLERMEVSGTVAEGAEKLLNEIDMNFQKLLALMISKMRRESGKLP